MTFEAYRSLLGVNFSSLKNILTSPAHYQAALTFEIEQSPDMLIGTLVHGWWLEGRTPPHVVKPEGMSFATKEGKAWRADQVLPILTQDESGRQIRMCQALDAHPHARRVLELCPERETTLQFSYRGVPMKCRIDAAGRDATGRRMVIDLKKCQCNSPVEWGKAVMNRRYAMQAALYCEGIAILEGLEEPPSFTWITCEDSDAAPVMLYGATEEFMDAGRRELDQAIDLLLKCTELNQWPGYEGFDAEAILNPVMPRWAA